MFFARLQAAPAVLSAVETLTGFVAAAPVAAAVVADVRAASVFTVNMSSNDRDPD